MHDCTCMTASVSGVVVLCVKGVFVDTPRMHVQETRRKSTFIQTNGGKFLAAVATSCLSPLSTRIVETGLLCGEL